MEAVISPITLTVNNQPVQVLEGAAVPDAIHVSHTMSF